ncbi:glutathione S-transferase family protein [Leeia oryzae]|uniref:glutathione S-transferase family protein n=1 Tax=Leeia oryzae TaxID=356662 RepID=UPI000375C2A0|nr:glutathione S-transferase family protein [Leeia oryzae]
MTVTLYQLPYSHYSSKVKIVLAEKGIPFEAPAITFAWPSSPEGLAVNPLGKVPFLVDGDVRLGESEVIAEYLEDAYPEPALLPVDVRQRAKSRWLSRFHDLYLGPQLTTLYVALSDGRAQQPGFGQEVDRLYELLALLESQIEPAPYFLGEQFTLADASFALSYVYIVMLSGAHGRPVDEARDMPKLSRWYAAVSQRPSVAKVIDAAKAALSGS